MLQFPCAKCATVLVAEPGRVVICRCDATYSAVATCTDGVLGVAIMLSRSIKAASAGEGKCKCCGERIGLAGYPALGLFRTTTCLPGCWHVVELTTVNCPACKAPLEIDVDLTATPVWERAASNESTSKTWDTR